MVNLITLFGSVILACFVLMVLGTLIIRIRNSRTAKKREGETLDDFVAQFAGQGLPSDVLKNTYEYFSEWNSTRSSTFPVRKEDVLDDIYGIVDEDVLDAIEEILTKSERSLITRENTLEPPWIETVGDVVLYVASAPRATNNS